MQFILKEIFQNQVPPQNNFLRQDTCHSNTYAIYVEGSTSENIQYQEDRKVNANKCDRNTTSTDRR